MPLNPGCPRCATPVARAGVDGGWSCPEHGAIAPLWRPDEASYDAFVEHLGATPTFPTYLPWPLSPGWRVTDFAAVGGRGDGGRAAMTCVSGTSELDGPVDVLVISEEAGTGLGSRVAGTLHDDPGDEIGQGPPTVRVRDRQPDRPPVAGLHQRVARRVGPLRPRRRGRRPLAVDGPAPRLRGPAAPRRLDPARRLRPRPAAGRAAVRGARRRLVSPRAASRRYSPE